ncbi:MAG: tetratricopeptide repeat protein [Saprospiraceae bacterium]
MYKPLILPLLFLLSQLSFSQEVPIESIIEDIRALIQAGRLAEAENLTNRYIVDDPINIDLLMMKGNVVLNKYIVEEQAQLSLRPNYEEDIYKLGQLEKGPHPVTVDRTTAEKVARLWRAAATLDPSRKDLQLGICQVYAISGMKEELLAYLPTAKEKAAGLDELHIQLARYARNLQERGDFDGAMEVYEKVAELFPEYPGLLSDMAGEYFYAGQLEKAKEYLRRSLAVLNADEATLGNAFFLSSMMGDYDTALEAIRRLPGNGSLLYEGVLKFYRNEKKWEKPIEKFLSENPDSSDAKAANILVAKDFKLDMDNYIGIIENDLGDPTKILIHEKFRETKTFLPAFNAAEAYCYNRRYDAAVAIFSEIENGDFDLDADDREQFLFYNAWSLHQDGQLSASVKIWEQLLDSEDFYKKSAAHWFVGKYYFDQGDKAKGRAYFSKMAVDPSASKYATMCWNYMGE